MSTKASGLFTMKFDRSAEKDMLRGYSSSAVEYILKEAARVGGRDGARVMRGAAPIGTASRQGQYYRRMGLGHGTFRKSVRAAAIRGRGSAVKGLQGKTVGYVIGPMGKTGFTRAWIELGTPRERATHWVARIAGEAFAAALRGSDAVLAMYQQAH